MERERPQVRRVDGAQPESGGTPGRRTRVDAAYPTLARSLAGAEAPTIHDAATAAVEHKDAGAPVDAGVAARVGAHLGADFSGVRVHADPLAHEASAAIGARAFAHGSDVFLARGESPGDLGLMAHELTHVAQQGAAGATGPQRKVEVGAADSPAEREADEVAGAVTSGARPAALLVDDGPVAPGQMLKSTFIAQLRAAVTAAADEELGPIYSAIGCPYIEQYFGRYAGRSAAEGEALLRRFAPGARGASDAAAMIPVVVGRVRDGVRHWRDTGQAPPEIAAIEPAAAGLARPPADDALPASPEQVVQRLGDGAPPHGRVAEIADALGVQTLRIHDGPGAAAMADRADAHAFALGHHVVFGAAALRPGSVEGDALIAHEVAHVAQQTGASTASAAPRDGDGGDVEGQADRAAGGVLARLYGGAKAAASSVWSGARAPVELARCGRDQDGKDTKPTGPAYAPKAITPNFILDKKVDPRSNTKSSTQSASDPTFTGEAAIDDPGKVWRYQLTDVESKGKIRIVYFTDDHYPAPTPMDDTGALSNVTSSNWREIVRDLEANKAGIPDFWSAYRAEDVHETYHWEVEWQGELKKELVNAEAEIAKLSLGFDQASTAADAEKILAPKAKKIFDDAMRLARQNYDALGDSPGDPPYRAQIPVVEALVKRVKDHAAAKGW